MNSRFCALLVVLTAIPGASCGSQHHQGPATSETRPTPAPPTDPATAATKPASDPEVTETPPSPPAPPPTLEGEDYIAQATLLYHIAACAPMSQDLVLPPHLDQAVVDKHCARVAKHKAMYRAKWLDIATPFLANVVPKGLPATLVYPFGGADLLTALVTYPDATEITAIALEGFGDPRHINELTRRKWKTNLKLSGDKINKFLGAAYNQTLHLHYLAVHELPGLLIMALLALDVLDYEPVSLRYFRFEDDGSIHYLTAEDIAHDEAKGTKHKAKKYMRDLQVGELTNAELRFRRRGAGDGAPIRVYRHIAQDLSDKALKRDPRLLRHLEAKGRVSMITKAAHYLLWRDDFALIRNYMLDHMEFMISDDSGIPNRFSKKKGFVQDTYGRYAGAFGKPSETIQRENIAMWKKNKYRPLPMVYGYPAKGRRHMLVTRKP